MERDDRKLSRVSRSELERRWELVRAHLRERGIDALVVQNARDLHGGYVKWLTDMPAGNPRTVIFHADDLMTVIDHGAAGGRRALKGDDAENPGVAEIITTAAFPAVHYTQTLDAAAVAAVLRRRAYRRVALVGAAQTPHAFVQHLIDALAGDATLCDETDALDCFKAVKSAEEIAQIRKAAALQDCVFGKVLAHVRPGLRDHEITSYAQYQAQLLGAESGIYLASSAPLGKAAFFAGPHLQGRIMRAGDHLSLLIENNSPGGWYTELARTIVLGKAGNELVDGFESCREAQAATVARLKPGMPCRDIAAAHDAFMTARGLPGERRLYCHSQGYDLVERPLVRADETMSIAAGMNMAVHPAFGTPTMFAHICDNFLVHPDAPAERLHTTAHKIFEL